MTVMTKEEFKARWEGDDNGGGINFDDIAECAIAWGITSSPRTRPMLLIRYQVLKAAGTVDAEEFHPDAEEPEEEDDEDQICSGCSGCGEGQYEGTSCYKCHGSGIEPVEKDDDV